MKKVKRVLMIIAAVAISAVYTANAQVAINTDGTNPNASAMLDVKSTDKGFLPPRVANVSAVSSPVAGLQVYDISNQCMRYYNGSSWSDCLGMTSNDANKTCGGTLTDAEGNTYATVQIGNQCWMAENLNVGTMINGSGNQTDNATIEKYCYGDNTSNCDTYGGLYQWDEMMQYVTTEGTQGICPDGWHLPSDDEWKTLEMQLGMTQAQADATGFRGTDQGSQLAGNEALWTDGNLDQNANFGTSDFTGLPAGFRHTPGSFNSLTNFAFFWSSSESGSYAWNRYLHYNYAQVYRTNYPRAYGFSVRCVRN